MTKKLEVMLSEIRRLDELLTAKYSDVLAVNSELDRTLVSYQANKTASEHRWCKYREGFSAALMHYVFDRVGINRGKVLDPFAGSGTTLFVASDRGIESVGIELLPSSAEIINVRRTLRQADKHSISSELKRFCESRVWEKRGKRKRFNHLRITQGAFPQETEKQLERYLFEADFVGEPTLNKMLRFAAMCILEAISYTRKDGQYLRWDWRSGRLGGKKRFDKGEIYSFTTAIEAKLKEISDDLDGVQSQGLLFDPNERSEQLGEIELLQGTCLEHLPNLRAGSLSGLITSPPYCNRYDYTRTYALELAYLGVDEVEIKRLRQTMVSCTVENREKVGLDRMLSEGLFDRATLAWQEQELLQLVLEYLGHCKSEGTLNNNGIPRMISNYFKEMSMVIFECGRILKPDAAFIMVNDNVRYQGAHLPVDLILSDFAHKAEFEVEKIWVLPKGKGNSSQQMGRHGRQEMRKCVYVWRKLSKTKAEQSSRTRKSVASVR
jgi:DNA modification methylase